MLRRLPFFITCLACLLSAAALRAAEVELVRVWPGWRDAESFERISEYFREGENTGGEKIIRTQADKREGFYFLVRTKSVAAISGVRFELSVIKPDSPEAKTYTFAASELPAKETVFQLGLTGGDWAGGKIAHPVAWKLVLVTSDGRALAERTSYLWQKPATK